MNRGPEQSGAGLTPGGPLLEAVFNEQIDYEYNIKSTEINPKGQFENWEPNLFHELIKDDISDALYKPEFDLRN